MTFSGARYRTPQRPEDRVVSGIFVDDWYLVYAIDLKFGPEGCSSDSISFHYVDEHLMTRLHRLIFACRRPSGVQLVGDRKTITPPATASLVS